MVAINPGSLASHQKWAAKQGFGFPICVDADKKVATAYGAINLLGGIKRCVIIVDRQGRVAWAAEGMPDTAEILSALDAMAADDPGTSRLSSS